MKFIEIEKEQIVELAAAQIEKRKENAGQKEQADKITVELEQDQLIFAVQACKDAAAKWGRLAEELEKPGANSLKRWTVKKEIAMDFKKEYENLQQYFYNQIAEV